MNALRQGDVLSGTYRVEKLLGRGGMAEVYRVAHLRLPRRFALKLLRLELARRADFSARFAREAEILGRLRHPHIVDVLDWNHTPAGEPYLVMELLCGEDLGRFLHRKGAVEKAQALAITAQIGAALSAAHRAGVVHRDLKPSNVFLPQRGPLPRFVKVLDFGIAAQLQSPLPSLTAAEEVLGTPGYLAPEQARGKTREADPRADQFALATIFYELVAGRPAFFSPGESVPQILSRVLQSEPPPLAAGIVDGDVARAIYRALRKRPEERFDSIDAFLEAISARPAKIEPAKAPDAVAGKSKKRRLSALTEVSKRRLWATAIVAALALCGAAWAIFVFLIS